MEVITYKCPNCGGDLTFDPASGKYKCEYCLSSFTQEEAEKAKGQAAGAAAHAAGQIGEEGMLRVHGDVLRIQLLFQPQGGYGIA